MEVDLSKIEFSIYYLKRNLLACIVSHNISIEKRDHINRSMDFTFEEHNIKRKLSKIIRRNLKMVSGFNRANTGNKERGIEEIRTKFAQKLFL